MMLHLSILQTMLNGCCDFIAQCIIVRINHHDCTYHPFYSTKYSKIYRCWIVYGQDIRVTIMPALLAIAYLGQSIYLYLISWFQLSPLATWLASAGSIKAIIIPGTDWQYQALNPTWEFPETSIWNSEDLGTDIQQGEASISAPISVPMPEGQISETTWGVPVTLTSFAFSMAVNTLVTGLIVLKILKVFIEVRSTSVERTLGTTGGTKLQHIIFVLIESGMALFVIQLVRFFCYLPLRSGQAYNVIVGINEMFNVIIGSVYIYFFFVLLTTFTWLGHHTNNNFGAGLNENILRWQRILQGSCRESLF